MTRTLRAAIVALSMGGMAAPAWAQPQNAPQQPPVVPTPAAGPTDANPLTPEDMEVLREVEADFERFSQAADLHHARMRAILLREFDERRQMLEKRYAERIDHTNELKRRRHLESIALLEKFIQDHPNHPEFTPDAMFRLADLYLDQAEYDLEVAEASGDPNFDPIADYSKSLALWDTIIERFPEYRQMAGTLYLRAYYGKLTDERKSLLYFLALVCSNKYKPGDEPPAMMSEQAVKERLDNKVLVNPYADCTALPGAEEELIRHAWVRGVGDHHFNVPGELDEAIAAYNKVTGEPEASLYPEALYKVAWSYYRRDYLLDAIKNFDQSVVLYDKTVAAGEVPKLELRDEALQYIAVSFTDPWEGELETDPVKAMQRAEDFYKGRENEPHMRDVWEVIGRAFMDLQAYDQAIDVFRRTIGPPWHLHPNNPVLHQEIVNALEAKGDKFAADEEAARLATAYAPGTEWYAANEKDREAMENQRQIGERMLYAAARNMHSAATQARQDYVAAGANDPAAKEEYLALYAKAIELYQSFMQQYPESDYTYDFMFATAEAQYFSEQYLAAIENYRWVRDHRELSEKHFQDAAQSIIQAYEAEVERRVAAGELQEMKVPEVTALKSMPQPIQPQPIPDIYVELRSAYDEYQQLINDPKTAPKMGLNAALVSVAYLHLDDGLARFEIVFDKFCGTDEAAQAKDGMLAIYEARGQDDKFRETNEKFISQQCGDKEAIELARSQNRSIEFRRANEMIAAGQYGAAGDAFYKYYKTAPDDDADLPTALYNAAIAYGKADRPKTSIFLFKEFTENNKENFRKSPYYLEALRLTAKAQQGTYDFDAAVKTYLEVYEQSKTAKRRGLTPPPDPAGNPQSFEQIKLDALFNAAAILELDRDFDAAVRRYRQYENEETDRRKKDRAAWAVARIYGSRGDFRNQADAYAAWRRKYGNDQGNADDYVFSFYDTAEAYAKKGRTRDADKYRQETITAWEKIGAPQGGRAARLAGEYALLFAERNFQSNWVPFRIKNTARTEKQAKAQKETMDKRVKETQDRYLALDKFGVLDYSMAAKVRFGETLTDYAQKFFEIPTPKYVIDLNNKYPDQSVLAKYEEGLAQRLAPLALEAKKEWAEVVDVGKKNGIANEWTQRALENLSKEFPAEYEALHQEIIKTTEEP